MEDVATVRRAVGAQIRIYRERQRWTIKQVAAKVGNSESSLSRIECGKQNVSLDDLVKLANVFEVPLVVSLGALAPQERQAHVVQVGQAVLMLYREMGRQLEQLLILSGAVGKDTEGYSLLSNGYMYVPPYEYAYIAYSPGSALALSAVLC